MWIDPLYSRERWLDRKLSNLIENRFLYTQLESKWHKNTAIINALKMYFYKQVIVLTKDHLVRKTSFVLLVKKRLTRYLKELKDGGLSLCMETLESWWEDLLAPTQQNKHCLM